MRREQQDLHTAPAQSHRWLPRRPGAASSHAQRIAHDPSGEPTASRSGPGGSPSSVLRYTTSLKVIAISSLTACRIRCIEGRPGRPANIAAPTSGVSAVRQARGGSPREASTRSTTSWATARAVVYFTASTVRRLEGPPAGRPRSPGAARPGSSGGPGSRPALSGSRPHCRPTTSLGRRSSPRAGAVELGQERLGAPVERGARVVAAVRQAVPGAQERAALLRAPGRGTALPTLRGPRRSEGSSAGPLRPRQPAADHQVERERVARRVRPPGPAGCRPGPPAPRSRDRRRSRPGGPEPAWRRPVSRSTTPTERTARPATSKSSASA